MAADLQGVIAPLTIRRAGEADLPALVAMSRRFLATVYAGRLADNPPHLEALGQQLLSGEHTVVFVAERAAGPIGMIGMMIYAHPMSGERTASEVMWWVEPEHRGIGLQLLAAATDWAVGQGAAILQLIAPSQADEAIAVGSVAELYHRLAFDRIETTYQKRLP